MGQWNTADGTPGTEFQTTTTTKTQLAIVLCVYIVVTQVYPPLLLEFRLPGPPPACASLLTFN